MLRKGETGIIFYSLRSHVIYECSHYKTLTRGQFHNLFLHPLSIFGILSCIWMALKASQKLVMAGKLFVVGHKQVYEIDPNFNFNFFQQVHGYIWSWLLGRCGCEPWDSENLLPWLGSKTVHSTFAKFKSVEHSLSDGLQGASTWYLWYWRNSKIWYDIF